MFLKPSVKTQHRLFTYRSIMHMKLTTVLIAVCVFQSFANVNAQISINAERVKLKTVMQNIKSQVGYVFFFRGEQIADIPVSLHMKNQSLEQVMDAIAKDNNLEWQLSNKTIVIRHKAPTVQGNALKSTQQTTITGKVVDENGNVLRGVTVSIKGKAITTTTDQNGGFRLTSEETSPVLTISSIGFQTLDYPTEGQQNLTIQLKADNIGMEEVVVVGYGTQKKENLTGSVSTLNLETVQNRVQPNLASAIQGTTPGVTVISRTGQTPSVNVRGRGNLGASSPLYVIDGAISTATIFNNLDPTTIKSVSFLKDAASASIYGSRAAYGVILVTTKGGAKGGMNVNYNGYLAFKSPTYLPKTVSSAQYAELMNEGMFNRNPASGNFGVFSQEQIDKFRDGSDLDNYPNTNWFDLALDKNVPTTNHSLNFSGGSEKISYFTAVGYNHDQAFTRGSSSKRYNLQNNITADVTDWLKLKGNINYIRNQGDVKNGLPSLMNFLIVPPTMVAQHSNGEWGSIAGGQLATQTFINGNPLRAYSKNDWSNSVTENTTYNLGFDLKPIEGLIVSGHGVMNRYEYKGKNYTALQENVKNFKTGAEIPGTGVYTNGMNMNWQSTQRMQYMANAEYQKTFGRHYLKAMVGTSYENYRSQTLSAGRKNFPIDGLIDIGAGSASGEDISNGGGLLDNKLLSYFGRVNYSFDDKYLLEANMRADASSSFHKDNRWGYFPSFSAGWKIDRESFMEDISWVSDLKLRASWGQLGNINNVGYYDYFQTYKIFPAYSFDDNAVTGVMESKPANFGLTWETVAMSNIGLDAAFFDGKLGITADYYDKKTSNILLAYNTPVEVGLPENPSQNIGKVHNRGFEFVLNYKNKIGDFKYDIASNFALNSNKITDLGQSDNMISNGGDKIRYINKVGEAIGSYYGYVTDGLYTQEEIDAGHYYKFGRVPNAGDIKYVPQREGVAYKSDITGDDRTVIGKDVPSFTYGLNLNMEYKDFYLSVFGQGIQGTSVGFESEQAWALFLNATPREYHLNRWTVNNPDPRALYPRIYGGSSLDNYNQNFSDFQIFDADYFRIKTITFGYNVPKTWTERFKIGSSKIFVTGENLFTIRADKKMLDFDPEAPTGRGLGSLAVKSIAVGLNVNF